MRREIEYRPALLASVSLALGIGTAYEPLCWLALLSLAVIFATPRRVAAIGLLGALGHVIAPSPPEHALDRPQYLHEVATITAGPKVDVDSQAFELQTSIGVLAAYAPPTADIACGDRIWIDGLAHPQREGMDSVRLSHGIIGRIQLEPDWQTIARGPWVYHLASRWRRAFYTSARGSLSEGSASMLAALTFNYNPSDRQDLLGKLRNTGTIHIISASGLHVVLLAGALQLALALLPIPRWAGLGLVVLFLGLYSLAVGLEPPILRSALMWTILAFAYLFRREPDTLSALGVAACVVMLWRPISVLEIGFYLSFGVVAAFAMFMPYGSRSSVSRAFADGARASAVAWLSSTPLVAWKFGTVSWVALPANLLIAPVVGPILAVAMLAHAVAGFAPAVGDGLYRLVVEPLMGWIEAVVNVLGTPAWASSRVPAFSAYWLVPLYASLLLLWRPRVRPAA